MKPTIDLAIIKTLVQEITSSNDFDIVGGKIVNAMTHYLGSKGGILLLNHHEENRLQAYSTSETKIATFTINKILKKEFRHHYYDYSEESNNLFVRTVRENRVFISDKFSDFISPEVPVSLAKLIQKISKTKCAISIPINFEEQNLGVLFIAFSKPEIKQDLYDTLLIFADYVAIAINNANQYENLQNEHKKMLTMYEIEQTSSNMLSHELKTPVAVLHNKVQMAQFKLKKSLDHLQKNLKEPLPLGKKSFWKSLLGGDNTKKEPFVQATQEIQEVYEIQKELELSIQKINTICDSIFQLREIENRPISVNTLDARMIFENSLRTFQERAKAKNLKFNYSIRLEQNRLRGHILQLEQILSILLDNAIKYTDEGFVRVKIHHHNKKIRIDVQDSGPGIPESEKELIFHRFTRGQNHKKKSEGLGLGLYIVKLLCDKIQARIFMPEKQEDKGTLFRVEMKTEN